MLRYPYKKYKRDGYWDLIVAIIDWRSLGKFILFVNTIEEVSLNIITGRYFYNESRIFIELKNEETPVAEWSIHGLCFPKSEAGNFLDNDVIRRKHYRYRVLAFLLDNGNRSS